MVAGIIAANTNNAAGIAGMTGSFPISLMPVKVLDQNGYGTMLDIINGITWAADQGADIINMSFGGRLPDYPLALAEAVQYAGNQGAIFIAAAGNEGVSLKGFYPADLEGVLCAAAYEKQATKYVIASFSNTDYLWNAYTKKCFLLPGVDIISTTRVNQYGLFSGTSASAAFLSSFAALVATCSDASEAKDRVLASIQSGAYYGDLTVGIFDAPTAYNVTDELWYYETDATPWGAFRYEGSNVVRNTVNLPVRALTAAGIKLEDNGIQKVFIDENDISEYAREAVKTLVARGILTGDDKGRFLPRKGANRAEAAKIIYLLR